MSLFDRINEPVSRLAARLTGIDPGAFPTPKKPDLGVPEEEFDADLQNLKSEGAKLKDVEQMINEMPEIKQKNLALERARKAFAPDYASAFKNTVMEVASKTPLVKTLAGIDPKTAFGGGAEQELKDYEKGKAIAEGTDKTYLPPVPFKGYRDAGKFARDSENVTNAAMGAINEVGDLTTKVLKKLEGRSTVSRQFIEDLTNSGDLKQAERDLIRKVLSESADSPLAAEARKYKTAEEFVKAANDPLLEFKTLKTIDDPDIARGTVKEAINDIGGIDNVRRGTVDITKLKTSENVSLYSPRSKAIMEEVKQGKITPIIADENLEIFDGNHRLGVYQAMGMKEVPVIVPKVTVGVKFKTYSQLTDIWNKAQKGEINVPDFANKVKTELLPLKRGNQRNPIYEHVSLPDELRGAVANYGEHYYDSPIKTSAGGVHNFETDNYFAHTRIEDLPTKKQYLKDKQFSEPYISEKQIARRRSTYESLPEEGGTRRVIEIQSDLFQKGRLEGEMSQYNQSVSTAETLRKQIKTLEDRAVRLKNEGYLAQAEAEVKSTDTLKRELARREKIIAEESAKFKLEPYRNTWHERVIREEIKQAAKDGKTKLQFPTGETALKIEGLGGVDNNWEMMGSIVEPADLQVGRTLSQGGNEEWIITDVLGDGKFKAIPKDAIGSLEEELSAFGSSPDDAIEALSKGDKKAKEILNSQYGVETFDISGKVDTSNPIYKFYEKDVQKYLTNKYGGKRVKDAQGVEWIEINVKPEQAKMPIEAFAAIPLVTKDKENK